MKLYESIYLKESSTEDKRSKIITAIEKKYVVKIRYDNDAKGERLIEIISFGKLKPEVANGHIKTKGMDCIRAWQISGNSQSFDAGDHKEDDPLTEISGYRVFRLDKIRSLELTNDIFRADKFFLRAERPKHNRLKGTSDKDMSRIYAELDLGGNIGLDVVFSRVMAKIKSFGKLSPDETKALDSLNYEDFVEDQLEGSENVASYQKFTPVDVKSRDVKAYVSRRINDITKSSKKQSLLALDWFKNMKFSDLFK